jgi:integrase
MENDKLIRLPIIYDAGGDLKKEWFVEFYVRNPKTNVLQRQRVKKGINSFHTVQGRYAAAQKMLNHWKDKLLAGWSPLTEQNVVYEDNLEFQTYIKNYRHRKSKNGTFRYFASKFMDWVKNKLEDSTLATYRSKMRLFDAWLEGNSLNQLDISAISNKVMVKFFTFIIEERKLSKISITKYRQILGQVFNFVKKERKQFLNPCYDLPETNRINDNTPQPIQQLDILKFGKEIKERDPQLWMACCFEYYCFIRPGKELRLLKIGDIDFGRGTIRVNSVNSKTVERRIGIPYEFLIELRDEYKLHTFSRDKFVFSKVGLPGDVCLGKNNLRFRFAKIRDDMDMPEMYKFYSWKHTGNVRAEDSGITLRELQDQNGHSSAKTTEGYLKNKRRSGSDNVINHFPSIYK